jgi:RNA polymerase sigma factor (sigma-70 family)
MIPKGGRLEQEFISQAKQGDTTAYENLVRLHQDTVFRLAYLLLGDASDAEDAAQETFIRAFRSLSTFDATRPFRPWLLSITANIVRNRRRAIGRYFAALQRFVFAAPVETSNAETESILQWEAKMLWKAVQSLNAIDQEVIYLRYFMELSVSETAEVLKVEQGTIKSRLSRALTRLREVILQDFPLLYEGRQA